MTWIKVSKIVKNKKNPKLKRLDPYILTVFFLIHLYLYFGFSDFAKKKEKKTQTTLE